MNAPTAVIYFDPRYGSMAKDLANRIRNDAQAGNPRTLFVWGSNFRNESDLQDEAYAVVIQRSLPNADRIAQAYQQFAADVQIHFIHDDGTFEDEPDEEPAGAPKQQARGEQPDASDSGAGELHPSADAVGENAASSAGDASDRPAA